MQEADRKRKQRRQNEKNVKMPHLLHCGELTGGRDGAEEGGGAAGLLLQFKLTIIV